MIDNLVDPIVLCFIAGIIAGVAKSGLRLPEALYETLAIYLLLAIGLKGGVQLAKSNLGEILLPVFGAMLLGIVIPFVAYFILRRLGQFAQADAAAIAAHYGSVSAVTFAIVLSYLDRMGVSYEKFVTVLLVLMEIPAIAVGIFIARWKSTNGPIRWSMLTHEVFLGKSVFLLIAGLVIGFVVGPMKIKSIEPLFFDLFSGALALFLLEMGLVASRRLRDLKQTGVFLIIFGMGMPLVSGFFGVVAGTLSGLSLGGTVVLATLAASASYIAAPAAMRIAVPQANPTLYLTASLGITFPFNIVLGIPLYFAMAKFIVGFWR